MSKRGYPPYNPVMMTALLLYAYCQGVYSSRRIAWGCEERMDFMAVTGLNRPDFRTVSDFRKRQLDALQGLFLQVLTRCQVYERSSRDFIHAVPRPARLNSEWTAARSRVECH